MSTAQRLASDGTAITPRRVTVAAVAITAILVGGSLFLMSSARSYTVSSQIVTAYVLWDDAQLGVFVHSAALGRSSMLVEQLRSGTDAILRKPQAIKWMRWGDVTRVVRYEKGLITPATYFTHDTDLHTGVLDMPRPRFVNGRALVIGGFWNGSAIEPLATQEYVRLSRDPAPDDPGRWQWRQMLQPSSSLDVVVVQVNGEAVTLRASRNAVEASIDLVLPGAEPVRLFEAKLGVHLVGVREYEAIFGEHVSR